MSVTERLMALGEGSVALTEDAPLAITQAIRDLVYTGAGCHVVITPTPIDPTSVSDASMLSAAMFTGKVDASPSRTELAFTTLHAWLDSYTETAFSRTSGTPTNWVDDVLINGLTRGTVSGGSNVTASFPAYGQTRRDILKAVADQGGWEYEIRPDFSINAGTSVWSTTPTVVLTNKSEGPDGTFSGLLGGFDDEFIEASNITTKVIALGQGSGSSIITGSATKTPALKDKAGNTPTLVSVVSAPTATTTTNANAIAAAINTAAAPSLAMQILTQYVQRGRGAGRKRRPDGSLGPGYTDVDIIQRLLDKGPDAAFAQPEVTSWSMILDAVTAEIEASQRAAAVQTFAASAVGGFGPTVTAGGGGAESQYVRRVLRAGDYVYVYDLESGLVNTGTQITYRGETIFPLTKRVLSLTWAIEAGYGVYVRSNASTPVYYDLTPYVQWEEPGASIEVGDRPASSFSSTVNRSNPAVERQVTAGGATTGTYTPTLTGLAIGTGGSPLNTAEWVFVGDNYTGGKGQLTVWGSIKFGTSGQTFPTNPRVSLPSGFEIATTLTSRAWGIWYMFDDNVPTDRIGTIFTNSATTLRLLIGGITSAVAQVTTTTPWTWASSDELIWQCTIPATRV